jgi:muramoyltetrapeptide carboxypeptidase LdcA involved in peptidoglycan recycling
MLIKPPELRPGDKVAAVTLSWGGPGTFPHRYEAGKRQLQDEFGLHVVGARHALKDAEWIARNPKARGRLLGGCLGVLDWLRGTQVWPEPPAWRDAILFLETSEDAPPPAVATYFLRTLAAMGILQRLAGLLFARPGGGIRQEKFDDYDQAILKVVAEEEGLTELPIITRMDFGHTDPMLVLPYGALAEIDVEREMVAIVENGVTE